MSLASGLHSSKSASNLVADREYVQLAESGAKWMNLLAAGRPGLKVPDIIDTLTPIVQNLTTLGLMNKTCAPADPLMHRAVRSFGQGIHLAVLTTDVYGFDEMPIAYNESVYEIFGAIKDKWPGIRTIATLNWEEFPLDLPINVWVDYVSDYGASPSYKTPTAKELLRQRWLASGGSSKTGPHHFWWYAWPSTNSPKQHHQGA